MFLHIREACFVMYFIVCSLPVLALILDDLGIDLIPSWHRNPCLFATICFMICWIWFQYSFDQTRLAKVSPWNIIAPSFFDPVPQGVFLKIPWLFLVPFWFHVGRFGLVFTSGLHRCDTKTKTTREETAGDIYIHMYVYILRYGTVSTVSTVCTVCTICTVQYVKYVQYGR